MILLDGYIFLNKFTISDIGTIIGIFALFASVIYNMFRRIERNKIVSENNSKEIEKLKNERIDLTRITNIENTLNVVDERIYDIWKSKNNII